MADDEPRAGELTTANYGWTKPTVGASDDAWGGYLNADLDGIDSTVHGISGVANAAYPASNPAGYITAAAIPAPYVLPTASTTVLGGVKVDGSTITISGGTISGTPSSGPPVTIMDTPPPGPQAGALWWDSVGGQMYVWFTDPNTSQWVLASNPGVGPGGYLPLNGGALSGPVSGPSATFANLSAPQAIGDNRIINGDMRIDQRNNGASGTAGGYTVDRWIYSTTQANKGTWQRGASGPTLPAFPYSLALVSSSAFAAATGDFFAFNQRIEADMISDLAWGTANAQPVTLSFWAASSLTGTFGGSITNFAGTRSYPFSYSIPIAAVWTKIVITIPGDTSGAWVLSGNAASMIVNFGLGVGATYSGPANAWGSANYVSATGAVSIVGTNGASFYVTGVKLEVGSVATPYNRQSLTKSMADCQRYYATNFVSMVQYGAAGNNVGQTNFLPVTMRAAPTVGSVGGSFVNGSTLTTDNISTQSFRSMFIITATGLAGLNSWTYIAQAEL